MAASDDDPFAIEVVPLVTEDGVPIAEDHCLSFVRLWGEAVLRQVRQVREMREKFHLDDGLELLWLRPGAR
jgi:hypothetical protein